MSATEQVVQLLGSLEARDRRWILQNLPPDVRARLVAHVDESTDSAELEWSSVITRLADVDAQALTHALEREPAWLVSAILGAANWSWRSEVLRALPPALRAELSSLDRIGSTLARPATEFVLRELAMRAQDWPSAPARRSGLRALLGRFSLGRGR